LFFDVARRRCCISFGHSRVRGWLQSQSSSWVVAIAVVFVGHHPCFARPVDYCSDRYSPFSFAIGVLNLGSEGGT